MQTSASKVHLQPNLRRAWLCRAWSLDRAGLRWMSRECSRGAPEGSADPGPGLTVLPAGSTAQLELARLWPFVD